MARARNQVIRSDDHDLLKRLYDEYVNYVGRQGQLDLSNNTLTLFALPRQSRSKSNVRP